MYYLAITFRRNAGFIFLFISCLFVYPFLLQPIDTRLLKISDLCYRNVVPINNVMHEEHFSFMNVYNAINFGSIFDLLSNPRSNYVI